ncbi:MAG: hypothetical protein RMJ98_16400, partial [Myxococcales bacterium]|nr:hypothetical protein [Polyangiaceae bacterium]MDW8250876.1 hypothetical protein [Myxococcales bacterium]
MSQEIVETAPGGVAAIDEVPRLDQLVDRKGLGDLVVSLMDLAGVPMRLFSSEGVLLAGTEEEPALFRYLDGLPGGRT